MGHAMSKCQRRQNQNYQGKDGESLTGMQQLALCDGNAKGRNLAALFLKEAKTEINEIYDGDGTWRPLIALVAHDNMKPMMVSFIQAYKEELSRFRLTGTGTTSRILKGLGLKADEDILVPSGPLGGDQVLGAMMTSRELTGLFFFRDPLSAHMHMADIEALGRLADVYQLYFSTNYRTAAAMVEEIYDKYFMAKCPCPLQQQEWGRKRGSVRCSQVPDGVRDKDPDLNQFMEEIEACVRQKEGTTAASDTSDDSEQMVLVEV